MSAHSGIWLGGVGKRRPIIHPIEVQGLQYDGDGYVVVRVRAEGGGNAPFASISLSVPIARKLCEDLDRETKRARLASGRAKRLAARSADDPYTSRRITRRTK